jgi:hypothetical protein
VFLKQTTIKKKIKEKEKKKEKMTTLEKKIAEDLLVPGIAELGVTIDSYEDLSFGKMGGLQSNDDLSKQKQESFRTRSAMCQKLPWWQCNNEESQGSCVYTNGKCIAAPIDPQNSDYYHTWLRVNTQVYASMPDPRTIGSSVKPSKLQQLGRRRRSINRP